MKFITFLFIFSFLSGCVQAAEPEEPTPPVTSPPVDLPAPVIEPRISVTESHGSISFHIPSQLLPGNLTINNQTMEATENTTVGFLQPSTSYAWTYNGNQTTEGQNSTKQSPYVWSQEPKIYPGAELLSCTLGFIFRDSTNETLYATTAGHCRNVGDTVTAYEEIDPLQGTTREEIEVGEVAYQIDNETLDIAFIRIRDDSRQHVSPELKHWTGPIGIELPSEMTPGTTLCFYGQGDPEEHEEFRKKCGSRTRLTDAPFHHEAYMVASGGDSGSPVLNMETGQAMGTVLGLSPPVVTLQPICYALQWLKETHNVELQLSTASFQPPIGIAPLPIGGPLAIDRESAPCELPVPATR